VENLIPLCRHCHETLHTDADLAEILEQEIVETMAEHYAYLVEVGLVWHDGGILPVDWWQD
jgi:hypothetical protein